jgi:hypothetical protein
MTGARGSHRVIITKVLVGATAALCLLVPGLVVSALLERAGAAMPARSAAQFLTTMAILLLLARYQRRARAKRRLTRE